MITAPPAADAGTDRADVTSTPPDLAPWRAPNRAMLRDVGRLAQPADAVEPVCEEIPRESWLRVTRAGWPPAT